MIKTGRHNNLSQFGPWNLILDSNEPLFGEEPAVTKKIPFSLKTNRTIRLPRIGPSVDPNSTSKKLALNLFKQSLQIPKSIKKYDYSRNNNMNKSLCAKYRKTNKKDKIYETLSIQLPQNNTLQRRLSTVQLGDTIVPSQSQIKTQRYSLNAEAAKKRSLNQIIAEMRGNHDLMNLYMMSKSHNRYESY